ncbi:MAG: site-2 protease family protein [Planctomycetaceae bacterium]
MDLMLPIAVLPLAAGWLAWLTQPSNWWVILQVAGGLGFVVFVHELGHFLVAKACGVKVEKFFVGFDIGGLKLASFRRGETEYGIGILPLGGYVKMLGQDDNPAAAAEEAERARLSGDLPPEPVDAPHAPWDPRSYPAQSVPERMAIISAGVIMNVIFAMLLATWAYGRGVRELTCSISSVRTGGAAWQAGLRTGDEITAIGGRKQPVFKDLQHGVTLGNLAKGIEFTIRRPGEAAERTVLLKPDTALGAPTVGVISPSSLALPTELPAGLPGSAGLAQPPLAGGDTIRAVDGAAVSTYAELLAALSGRLSAPVTLTVERPAAAQGAAPTTLSIELPPQHRRTLGLAMTPGEVRAVQADSPAAAAGIRTGDRIVAVNGADAGDPLTLDDRLRPLVGERVTLTLGRDGEAERTVDVVPREVRWRDDDSMPVACVASVPSLGLALVVDALVAAVEAGGPAAKAGLAPGDRVTRAWLLEDGTKAAGDKGVNLSAQTPNWPALASRLQFLDAGDSLRLAVTGADGAQREVDVVPEAAADLFVIDRGLVFEPLMRQVRADSLGGALRMGMRQAGDDLRLVYGFLGKLFRRDINPRLVGGPIEIAKQAGRHAREGFSRLLLFLAMLSANLAVVNFLPIPVLDGGHMVFLLYELVFRRPPSERVVVTLSYLGLALLLSMMLFVFFLDLNIIPRFSNQ